jgi:hypothetical protein
MMKEKSWTQQQPQRNFFFFFFTRRSTPALEELQGQVREEVCIGGRRTEANARLPRVTLYY